MDVLMAINDYIVIYVSQGDDVQGKNNISTLL